MGRGDSLAMLWHRQVQFLSASCAQLNRIVNGVILTTGCKVCIPYNPVAGQQTLLKQAAKALQAVIGTATAFA